jgi:long-chain acyl-CoA synthetase
MTANPKYPDGETIPQMFWNAARMRGDRVILREKDLGIWRAMTWRQAAESARNAGLGLVSFGFEPGECASVLANNVKEWMLADLGVLGAGGVCSGVYPTDAAKQVEYLLKDSKSVYVFVEDEEQLDKVLEVRGRLPALRKIIVFDMKGLHGFSDPMVTTFGQLLEAGAAYGSAHPGLWEQRLESRKPAELAILVYTSGTTGPPKGAMLSHHNVVFFCHHFSPLLPVQEGDERMSFLPMCHVAERVVGLYLSLYTGTVMNFVENPETVLENVREIQPSVFVAVPRIWEKFYSGVTVAINEATALQRWAYRVALRIGFRVAERQLAGRRVPLWLAAANRIGYWVALRNVRKMIGVDRCRFVGTGAAPISPELIRWYLAIGLRMFEAYGQTESTAICTVMPLDRIKPGTVGKPVPYGELKISPEGEILARGEHIFMGYFNNPEKTRETIRDGWLHTGDVGYLDEDGYVKLTDRMKDIIVTAGGKNITPSEIENQLKFSPYITDAVVIGDRRKFLTALIMIDHENVARLAQERNIPFSNFASLCRAKDIVDLIGEEVEKVNRNLARVETIKKFRLIEQQLTPEDEELTPTMKLKRKVVNEKYKDMIEAMYREAS